jgi:hypothetical protein
MLSIPFIRHFKDDKIDLLPFSTAELMDVYFYYRHKCVNM